MAARTPRAERQVPARQMQAVIPNELAVGLERQEEADYAAVFAQLEKDRAPRLEDLPEPVILKLVDQLRGEDRTQVSSDIRLLASSSKAMKQKVLNDPVVRQVARTQAVVTSLLGADPLKRLSELRADIAGPLLKYLKPEQRAALVEDALKSKQIDGRAASLHFIWESLEHLEPMHLATLAAGHFSSANRRQEIAKSEKLVEALKSFSAVDRKRILGLALEHSFYSSLKQVEHCTRGDTRHVVTDLLKRPYFLADSLITAKPEHLAKLLACEMPSRLINFLKREPSDGFEAGEHWLNFKKLMEGVFRLEAQKAAPPFEPELLKALASDKEFLKKPRAQELAQLIRDKTYSAIVHRDDLTALLTAEQFSELLAAEHSALVSSETSPFDVITADELHQFVDRAMASPARARARAIEGLSLVARKLNLIDRDHVLSAALALPDEADRAKAISAWAQSLDLLNDNQVKRLLDAIEKMTDAHAQSDVLEALARGKLPVAVDAFKDRVVGLAARVDRKLNDTFFLPFVIRDLASNVPNLGEARLKQLFDAALEVPGVEGDFKRDRSQQQAAALSGVLPKIASLGEQRTARLIKAVFTPQGVDVNFLAHKEVVQFLLRQGADQRQRLFNAIAALDDPKAKLQASACVLTHAKDLSAEEQSGLIKTACAVAESDGETFAGLIYQMKQPNLQQIGELLQTVRRAAEASPAAWKPKVLGPALGGLLGHLARSNEVSTEAKVLFDDLTAWANNVCAQHVKASNYLFTCVQEVANRPL